MGIGLSKSHNSPLASLCKQRKELTKAAMDCRYEFSSAHILYFQSLLDVGNAFTRFVDEDLVFIMDAPDGSFEDESHLRFPSIELESGRVSLIDYVHHNSDVSESHTDYVHHNSEASDYEDDTPMPVWHNQDRSILNTNHITKLSEPSLTRTSVHTTKVADSLDDIGASFRFPNVYLPSDVNNGYFNNVYKYHVAAEAPSYDLRHSQYNDEVCIGDDMTNFGCCGQTHSSLDTYVPFLRWFSTRNYFDPLNENENFFLYLQSQDRNNDGSLDHGSVSVGKNWGIPDVGVGIQENFVKEVSEKRDIEGDVRRDADGSSAISKVVSPKIDENALLNEDEHDKIEANILPDAGHQDVEEVTEAKCNTTVTTVVEEDIAEEGDVGVLFSEDIESIRPISFTRDFQEVVKDIVEEFDKIFHLGKEVSVLLEAGKLPHRTMGSQLLVNASRLVNLVLPSTSPRRSSYMLAKKLSSRSKISEKATGNIEDSCSKFGDLSCTLERLYLWEKKLYEEVMDVEKLRIIYEKKCKMLKNLDDKGSDSSKIDRTQSSMKRLLSKINVTVTTADAISARSQKLRDAELQLQLNGLIQGLLKMWSFTTDSHRRQLQVIMEAKSYAHLTSIQVRRNSGLKATLELEEAILNWSKCFSYYVTMQKSFAKLLKDGLMRCISPEETHDESIIPPIFITCNDWDREINNVSEMGVSKTLGELASCLHQLWEKKQAEGRHTRTPVDGFSREFILTCKKMDEEKRHREVNEIATRCLRDGLTHIFAALESFCSDITKVYEQVRFPNRPDE